MVLTGHAIDALQQTMHLHVDRRSGAPSISDVACNIQNTKLSEM